MTRWTLPEGRKPAPEADIAALTRRLAGTAVDYKELYEAAKRDAEEAEAYAAELEAKLAQAVEALGNMVSIVECSDTWIANTISHHDAAITLAELKGEKND